MNLANSKQISSFPNVKFRAAKRKTTPLGTGVASRSQVSGHNGNQAKHKALQEELRARKDKAEAKHAALQEEFQTFKRETQKKRVLAAQASRDTAQDLRKQVTAAKCENSNELQRTQKRANKAEKDLTAARALRSRVAADALWCGDKEFVASLKWYERPQTAAASSW